MRKACLLSFLLLLIAPAVPQPITLDHLLSVEKGCWSPAWVSSGFHDWRTVSKYRSRAGLHLGYDIAMPFGSPVAAAWSGVVVAVTPWTSTEYGVTVKSPEGWEVTYGHIAPGVSVGAKVHSGTIIGTIASDHVDVKMRDATGAYVPFDQQSPAVLQRSAESLVEDYKKQREEQMRLDARQRVLATSLQSEEERLQSVRRKLTKARKLAQSGLLSMQELQELEFRSSQAANRPNRAQTLLALQSELKTVEENLATLIEEAQRRGIHLPVTSEEPETTKLPTTASSLDRLRELKEKGLISSKEWRAAGPE